MKVTLRAEAKFILKTLLDANYQAYLVGGAVRDLIVANKLNLNPKLVLKDYDFATNATPLNIQKLFPKSFYENQFGTVAITHQELLTQMNLKPTQAKLNKQTKNTNSSRIINLTKASKIHSSLLTNTSSIPPQNKFEYLSNFEITTFRSSEIYQDFRRPNPKLLKWGKNITEDLTRRDFTINAMALELISDDNYKLIDPHHGAVDLENNLIKTVGDPKIRFQEDALRMLRAIRFAVELNIKIDQQTFQAITTNSNLIIHISQERISDELLKILANKYPAEGIKLMDKTGLLEYILPELELTKGVKQGGHHTTDVWTHSLDSVQECPNHDPIVRLATLLHDIGKPATCSTNNAEITFYNHEVVGSRIANQICQKLKLPNTQRKRVFNLVRHHMFHYQPEQTDAAIRRFMRKVGLENIDDILDLREADRLGSGAKKTSWRLEEMKKRMLEQLHQPLAINDLIISGHDLIKQFQIKPGPWLGKLLALLLEKVINDPKLNSKKQLLKLATELFTAEKMTTKKS